MAYKPYADEEWLRDKWFSDLSHPEIAEAAGCSTDTITRYARKFDLPHHRTANPWRDPDELRRLYHEEQMSQSEIADHFDCSPNTITKWMGRYGIERRSVTARYHVHNPGVHHRWNAEGYEMVGSEYDGTEDSTMVHRLIAIAEGADPYDLFAGRAVVHHENGVAWDNRPANLTVMTPEAHGRLHRLEQDDHDT